MQKVIFLDRDGVINDPQEHYYVHRIEDLLINEGLVEALQKLRDRGFAFVVISNQGGISKEEFTAEDVDRLHKYLADELGRQGIEFLEIYYCPHHDSIENCLCRKPNALMLEKAIARFDIDREQSWFIGDKESDIAAGKAVGLKTLLVKKNQDLREILGQIS